MQLTRTPPAHSRCRSGRVLLSCRPVLIVQAVRASSQPDDKSPPAWFEDFYQEFKEYKAEQRKDVDWMKRHMAANSRTLGTLGERAMTDDAVNLYRVSQQSTTASSLATTGSSLLQMLRLPVTLDAALEVATQLADRMAADVKELVCVFLRVLLKKMGKEGLILRGPAAASAPDASAASAPAAAASAAMNAVLTGVERLQKGDDSVAALEALVQALVPLYNLEPVRRQQDGTASEEEARFTRKWWIPFVRGVTYLLKAMQKGPDATSVKAALMDPKHTIAVPLLVAASSGELRQHVEVDGAGEILSSNKFTVIAITEKKISASGISDAKKQLNVSLRFYRRVFEMQQQEIGEEGLFMLRGVVRVLEKGAVDPEPDDGGEITFEVVSS